MWISKLIKHGHSRGITIPVEMLRQLGWGVGDLVTTDLQDGTISIRLLADVKPELRLRHSSHEERVNAEA
jgi:antitoxin component of MazEF toxin-antitoxin module